jgi:hypothetical protein
MTAIFDAVVGQVDSSCILTQQGAVDRPMMTVGDPESDFQDPLEMEVSDACSPLSVSLLSPLWRVFLLTSCSS